MRRKHKPDEHAFVTQLLDDCPEAKLVQSLAQQFIVIIRERKVDALNLPRFGGHEVYAA